jgi:hypothetical protein
LSGDANPHVMCRQASEAIISQTSTYQTQHSLAYLPPLLPYMVFGAVLHQLSLMTGRQHRRPCESPEPLSPQHSHGSAPSFVSTGDMHVPQIGPALSAAYAPDAQSPYAVAQRRRSSNLSTATTCCSPGDHTMGAGPVRSLGSDMMSAKHEPSSPGTAALDTLPTFTSRPADLVTLGSLQLASMSSHHPGAAEAIALLRTVASVGELGTIPSPQTAPPIPGVISNGTSARAVSLCPGNLPGDRSHGRLARTERTARRASMPGLGYGTHVPPTGFLPSEVPFSEAIASFSRPLLKG